MKITKSQAITVGRLVTDSSRSIETEMIELGRFGYKELVVIINDMRYHIDASGDIEYARQRI